MIHSAAEAPSFFPDLIYDFVTVTLNQINHSTLGNKLFIMYFLCFYVASQDIFSEKVNSSLDQLHISFSETYMSPTSNSTTLPNADSPCDVMIIV